MNIVLHNQKCRFRLRASFIILSLLPSEPISISFSSTLGFVRPCTRAFFLSITVSQLLFHTEIDSVSLLLVFHPSLLTGEEEEVEDYQSFQELPWTNWQMPSSMRVQKPCPLLFMPTHWGGTLVMVSIYLSPWLVPAYSYHHSGAGKWFFLRFSVYSEQDEVFLTLSGVIRKHLIK